MNPHQSVGLVGSVGAAFRERACCSGENPLNSLVPSVQPTGGRTSLIQAAEDQREHDLECAVKAADRVGQGRGVLGDARRDPGMSELKQQRAPCAEEEGRLAIHPPDHRFRAEHARRLTCSSRAHPLELALQVNRADA